jgi:hypothetical protein
MQIYEGTKQIQRVVMARQILKQAAGTALTCGNVRVVIATPGNHPRSWLSRRGRWREPKARMKLKQKGWKDQLIARLLQRILALTAAIWHNDHTGHPVKRSLVAYDH